MNGILISNGKYVVTASQVGVQQPAVTLQGCPANTIPGSPTAMKSGTIYYVQYTIVGEMPSIHAWHSICRVSKADCRVLALDASTLLITRISRPPTQTCTGWPWARW